MHMKYILKYRLSFVCFIVIALLSPHFIFVTSNFPKQKQQEDSQAKKLIEDLTYKIHYCLSLLEKASRRHIYVRDLVSELDHALQLKHIAEMYYHESQYQKSIDSSLEALDLVETIIESANQLLVQEQKTTIVEGIALGVGSAIGILVFLFLFLHYIRPWYKKQQISQYEDLEIMYKEEEHI